MLADPKLTAARGQLGGALVKAAVAPQPDVPASGDGESTPGRE